MNFKRLFLICLLLAVFTIAAVSAEDNQAQEIGASDASENIHLPEDIVIDEFNEDDFSTSAELKKTEIAKGEDMLFSSTITSGMHVRVMNDTYSKDYGNGYANPIQCISEDEIDGLFKVDTNGLMPFNTYRFIYDDDFGTVINTTFYVGDFIIDMSDKVFISENDVLRVYCADDATGQMEVLIDGEMICNQSVDGKSSVFCDLSNLTFESHNATIRYYGGNYEAFERNYTFQVTYRINAQDESFPYRTYFRYHFTTPPDFNAKRLSVKIDGGEYSTGDIDVYDYEFYNYCIMDVSSMSIGKHNISIRYSGDDRYGECVANVTITVNPTIYPHFSSIYVGETQIFSCTVDDSKNCIFKVYIDNSLYGSTSAFKNGKATLSFKNLTVGTHEFLAFVSGKHPYGIRGKITVGVYIYVPVLDAGEYGEIEVRLPNAKGTVTAYFSSKKVSAKFANGVAKIPIPTDLKVPGQYFNVVYDSKVNGFNVSEYLLISCPFNVPRIAYSNDSYVTVSLPYDDPNAMLVVEISNRTYNVTSSARFENGKAKVAIGDLAEGTYTVFPKYFDGSEWEYHGTVEMTVKKYRLTGKDVTSYYKVPATLKVRLTHNGKAVKSQYVSFYINGKYYKKVRTDAKGYATLKISKLPGSYKVTAKYSSSQDVMTLKVKHVVTLKAVTVKKSAKKLVLKATLKQGKKALKYKKVTFKFKGKTYKAKTNKYGVAKVTIKKAVLKKLKVGKNVSYQATYLKDTVKRSAKVKK